MKLFASQQGFSLLELLTALIILSIGLLAFAKSQVTALRDNQTAHFYSLANTQTLSLVERLRACEKQSTCIAQAKSDWQNENQLLLPAATSTVNDCTAICEITIAWQTVDHNYKVTLKAQL